MCPHHSARSARIVHSRPPHPHTYTYERSKTLTPRTHLPTSPPQLAPAVHHREKPTRVVALDRVPVYASFRRALLSGPSRRHTLPTSQVVALHPLTSLALHTVSLAPQSVPRQPKTVFSFCAVVFSPYFVAHWARLVPSNRLEHIPTSLQYSNPTWNTYRETYDYL